MSNKHKILAELAQRSRDYEGKKNYPGVSVINRGIYRAYIQELQSVITWIEDNIKEEQGR